MSPSLKIERNFNSSKIYPTDTDDIVSHTIANETYLCKHLKCFFTTCDPRINHPLKISSQTTIFSHTNHSSLSPWYPGPGVP